MVSARRIAPAIAVVAVVALLGSVTVLRAGAQDTVADALEEIAARTDELSVLEAEVVASQKRADEVTAEFWQHQQAVWQAQDEAAELSDAINTLSVAIDSTSERIVDKAIEQYMAPENFTSAIDLESVTEQMRAGDLASFVQNDAARTVEDLEAMVREREVGLDNLSKLMAQQEADAEAAEALGAELAEELAETRSKRDDLDGEIERLRVRLDELEAQEAARVAAAEAESAASADLASQLDDARESLDELGASLPTSVSMDSPPDTSDAGQDPAEDGTDPAAGRTDAAAGRTDAAAGRTDAAAGSTDNPSDPAEEPAATPEPSATPTTAPEPTETATPAPSPEATPEPPKPAAEPTPEPTPTTEPTPEPTPKPTEKPTDAPAPEPTPEPAPDVSSGGGYVCPLGGPFTHIDDYGASRPQGGHEGNDLMADTGTPIIAVTSGRLEHKTGGLGGLTARIHGDDGGWYYFAHMSAYENEGIGHVSAGEVIGYVGNSGDAAVTPPHLHFEMHLGGYGNPVNPYPYVVTACGH